MGPSFLRMGWSFLQMERSFLRSKRSFRWMDRSFLADRRSFPRMERSFLADGRSFPGRKRSISKIIRPPRGIAAPARTVWLRATMAGQWGPAGTGLRNDRWRFT
jgi:hypothetical protein